MRKYCTGLALILAANTLPALACLNDREVVVAENEFKSAYITRSEKKSTPMPIAGWLAIAAGVGLAAGALVITRRS